MVTHVLPKSGSFEVGACITCSLIFCVWGRRQMKEGWGGGGGGGLDVSSEMGVLLLMV